MPLALPMEKTLRFPSANLELEGRIHLPENRSDASPRGCVVCHPHPLYGGDMDNGVVVAITAALAARGIATLRFNFRGVGASGGTHGGGAPEAGDARAAVAALRTASGSDHVVLAGYSFGSVVALQVAAHASSEDAPSTRVDAVAAVAPPLAMFDASFVSRIDLPLLFVAGDRDAYCPRERFESLDGMRDGARATRRVLLDGADHFFGGFEDRVGEILADWAMAGGRAGG